MANKNIQGITIELNGDETPLKKALSNIEKSASSMAGELKAVERSLKFDPTSTELLTQKQELLTKQIEETSNKLNVLRHAQSQVEEQFKNGKIDEKQYREFQREVINTEAAIQGLIEKLSKFQQEQAELNKATKQLDTLFKNTKTSIDDYADSLGSDLVKAVKSGNASLTQINKVISKVGKAALGAETDIKKLTEALEKADGGESLEISLRMIEKEAAKVAEELKSVDRALKFDPTSTELIAQKQGLLAKQIEITTNKLGSLRSEQAKVEQEFQSGAMDGETYRAFQREIINTENALSEFEGKLSRVKQEQIDLASATRLLETLFKATESSIDDYADSLGVGLVAAVKSGKASLSQMERVLTQVKQEQIDLGSASRQLETLLKATKTSIDDYADSLGTDLVSAVKNGKASLSQMEHVLTEVGKSALGAEVDIQKMTAALKKADDGSSLKSIKKELNNVAKEAKEASKEVNSLGSELGSIAGGLTAGAGIAGTISKALDTSSLNTKIDISFDVPESSKKSVKEAIKAIEAYGVDGVEALEGVRRQWALNKTASDAANSELVKQAGVIATSYDGIDFIELIQETNEIAAALNISNSEAIALTNSLLKAGFPPEQLDTIAEYGQQMQAAGYNAQQIQAIFEAGINTKTWNIDNLNDGVKQARIQMSTFGQEIPDALSPLLEQAGMAEEKFQKWGKAVATGGKEGSQAMSEVVQWLNKIEDESLQSEIATQVFGTKWEDQGQNMIAVFKGIDQAMDKSAQNAKQLGDQMNALDSDPAVKLKQALNDIITSLEPLLLKISEFVTKIADWAAENPKLASTLTAIATALGIVMGAIVALSPVLIALTTTTTALGISINAAIWPITLAVAAITALIAAGVALYMNWDEVVAWCKKTWETVKTTMSEAMEKAKNAISTAWEAIKNTFSTTIENIKTGVLTKFNEIKTAISNKLNEVKTAISTTWENIKNAVVNALTNKYKAIVEKFTAIKTAISEKLNEVKTGISTIWNNIKDAVVNKVKEIVTGIGKTFSNMKQAVSDKMSSIRDDIKNIWDSIINFLKSIDLLQVGKDIMQGLVNGIKSMGNQAVQAAKDIASDIGSSVKDFFGIHSPSRLMMGYGENISEGLANGIAQASSKVVASASNISKAVTSAMEVKQAATIASTTVPTASGGVSQQPSIINFERMFDGSTIIVRNDNDIKLIAQEMFKLQRMAQRGMGIK